MHLANETTNPLVASLRICEIVHQDPLRYLCKRYFNLASLFTHNPVTCHLDAVFSVSHLFHVRCVVASGGGDGWFSHFFMLGLIIVVFSRLYSLIVHIFTASVIFMRSAV